MGYLLLFILGVITTLIILAIITKKSSLTWLEEEIPKWKNKGIISEEQGASIYSFYEKKEESHSNLVPILGSIFFGIGVILLFMAFLTKISNIIWLTVFITIWLLLLHILLKNSAFLAASSIGLALSLVMSFLRYEKSYLDHALVLPLILLFYLVYKNRSRLSLAINIISSLLWINLFASTKDAPWGIPLILVSSLGIILYLIGMLHKDTGFRCVYKALGFLSILIPTYILSFAKPHYILPNVSIGGFYSIIVGIAIGICPIFMALNYTKRNLTAKYELLFLLLVFIVNFSIFFFKQSHYSITAINIDLLLLAIFPVIYGFLTKNMRLFKIGIFIFAIVLSTMLGRYFVKIDLKLCCGIFFFITGSLIITYHLLKEKWA
ncbi:TPA: hypothetical protein DCX16_00400 [bacterium]|nr:hypothetical protein [bacterium]